MDAYSAYRTKCCHAQDEMCACISGMNTAKQLIFFAGNIRDVGWELAYATLASPGSVRLCIAGTCGECGKRLCCGVLDDNARADESLLESVYSYISAYDRLCGSRTDKLRFDADFLGLFHEQDRNAVWKWLKTRAAI